MALVKKKNRVYSWPVKVSKPSDDHFGEFEELEFIVKFYRLKTEELTKFDEVNDNPLKALKMIVKGWINYTDEDGKDIPYNDKELEELADDPDVVKGITDSYKDFYSNAQVKN